MFCRRFTSRSFLRPHSTTHEKVQLIFGTLTGHCVQVILHLVNVVRYNVEHRLHSRELGLNESRRKLRLSQLREDPVLRAPSSKKTEMQPLR